MQFVTLLMTKREIRSKECVSHIFNSQFELREKE